MFDETLALLCATVIEEQQRGRAHVFADERLPNHRIIGRRQGDVLAGRVDVAHATFQSVARVGRADPPALNISSVAFLAVVAAWVDASHSMAR